MRFVRPSSFGDSIAVIERYLAPESTTSFPGGGVRPGDLGAGCRKGSLRRAWPAYPRHSSVAGSGSGQPRDHFLAEPTGGEFGTGRVDSRRAPTPAARIGHLDAVCRIAKPVLPPALQPGVKSMRRLADDRDCRALGEPAGMKPHHHVAFSHNDEAAPSAAASTRIPADHS
jgi:hypothetical protein